MFVCLSVGMWWANRNPNHCTDLDKILHTHPHLSKEGFDAVLTAAPHPPGPGMLEPLKAKGYIFENWLQNKRCTACCKSNRAAPGTSASIYKGQDAVNLNQILKSYEPSILDDRATLQEPPWQRVQIQPGINR